MNVAAELLDGGIVVARQALERIGAERLMIEIQEVIGRLGVEAGGPPKIRIDRALDDIRRAASRTAAAAPRAEARSSGRR